MLIPALASLGGGGSALPSSDSNGQGCTSIFSFALGPTNIKRLANPWSCLTQEQEWFKVIQRKHLGPKVSTSKNRIVMELGTALAVVAFADQCLK
jgi:hypothetical protein